MTLNLLVLILDTHIYFSNSKSVTITVTNGTQEETLILLKGKEVEVDRSSVFKKREVGLSLFIDTSIGLTIQWDKGTHVIVKLDEQHSGKVEGLCGNYDQNSKNDFITSGYYLLFLHFSTRYKRNFMLI